MRYRELNPDDQFRIFYNRSIYPELFRLERRRLRLLRLIALALALLFGAIVLHVYLRLLALTLLLTIPLSLYITYAVYRIYRFIHTFKPRVMQLILNFLSEQRNIGDLHYQADGKIPKDVFLASRLFLTKAPFYEAEDYIRGRVGEMDFELCELHVREISPVRNRLNYVFKGVFLKAVFPEEVQGEVLVWPREFRQYLSKPIREFTFQGGKNMDIEINDPDFKRIFMTYATEETHVQGVISEPMQSAVVQYYQETGKEIYLSFQDREIYVGVTEPRNILEPRIFRSNVSYNLVREFFEDIQLTLRIVRDFDQMH